MSSRQVRRKEGDEDAQGISGTKHVTLSCKAASRCNKSHHPLMARPTKLHLVKGFSCLHRGLQAQGSVIVIANELLSADLAQGIKCTASLHRGVHRTKRIGS